MQLGTVEDEDISKELEKQYKKQGIEIMTNASVESVDTNGAGVKATVKKQDGSVVVLEAGMYRDWETDRKSTRLNSSHRL